MKQALAILVLLALFGCAGSGTEGGVPRAASDKYSELSGEYSGGLGAVLSNCTKNGQNVFIVFGSGGFSGVTYIYDSQGRLLQQYDWDDMVEPGETPPPYDSSAYECAILNRSKPVAPPPSGGVPQSARDKYDDLAGEYSAGLGAYLERCEKPGSTVYAVSGSGGFSGVTYYYDANGSQIGPAFYWDDTVEPNEPLPPVDTSSYSCDILERSGEGFVPETPSEVEDGYQNLSEAYDESLGASLYDCSENGSKKYIVVGSGGFSGITVIYDANGSEVRRYSWDDIFMAGEEPAPFDTERYDCALVRESKPMPLPTEPEDEVREFIDAGCTFDGSSLDCSNTSIDFGCTFGMQRREEGATLDPRLNLVQCNVWVHQQNLSAEEMDTFFYCSGGLLFTCKSYVYGENGSFFQIRNLTGLAAKAGPVDSAEEAMAFVMLSNPVYGSLTVDDKAFFGGSEPSGEDYRVTVYAPDRVFGCYDEVNYEEIIFTVGKNGSVAEESRSVVHNRRLDGAICVD
ncbi:MAG: hypothetical protein AB1324_01420 [Candidatus Micrarchaeota archaeon]